MNAEEILVKMNNNKPHIDSKEVLHLWEEKIILEKAFLFLQERGLRFCVDFGWKNAIELANNIAFRETVEKSEKSPNLDWVEDRDFSFENAKVHLETN